MDGIPLTLPIIRLSASAQVKYHYTTVLVYQGDILALTLDALFNPTRKVLVGSIYIPDFYTRIGVAHFARISKISQERRFPTGDCVRTIGYDLKYKYVISSVFPDCRTGKVDIQAYKRAVQRGMQMAMDNSVRSMCFPVCGVGDAEWDVKESIGLLIDTIFRLARAKQCCEMVVICDRKDGVIYAVIAELNAAVRNFTGIDYYEALDRGNA